MAAETKPDAAQDEVRLCGNCRFFKNPDCYSEPPRVFIVMRQSKTAGKIATGQPEMTMEQVPATVRPVVKPADIACKDHRFHDEVTDGEIVGDAIEALYGELNAIRKIAENTAKVQGIPSGRVVTPGEH